MSYKTQAAMAIDSGLTARVTACAASQGEPSPDGWAFQHRWQLSAQPGWDDAYSSAIASGVESPGGEESVITDGMILAAVQKIRAKDA